LMKRNTALSTHCFPNPIQAQLPQLWPRANALQSLPMWSWSPASMRRPSHVNGKEDDKFNNCLATGLGKGPSPNWVWWDTHSKQKKAFTSKGTKTQTNKQTNKQTRKQTNKQTNNQPNKQAMDNFLQLNDSPVTQPHNQYPYSWRPFASSSPSLLCPVEDCGDLEDWKKVVYGIAKRTNEIHPAGSSIKPTSTVRPITTAIAMFWF